uniref:Methyltransferase like 25B n=1 Tax=Tetraodon nigroviridis TaxID=99883 RepID=H3D618_TETNG
SPGVASCNLSGEQQRELAKKITSFLSLYTHISDSYIIEFFSEDLWKSLPVSWQLVLQDLSYQQTADLLLDSKNQDRSFRYASVWPLSLLAFRTTAHRLAFPRDPQQDPGARRPEEFQDNQSQSSMLRHVFRKHVKPKKQHEIRKLGTLVKQLSEQTACSRVVDVGSGQGHLTRFLTFGLGLSVTAIEADGALVAMATKFDAQLVCALEKEKQRTSSCSLVPAAPPCPRHVAGWINPRASWEDFLVQLEDPSQPAHPDFILTGLHACGDLSATLLRHFVNCPHVCGITSVACCYMKLSTKEFGYPMSSWVQRLPGHQLSYKAREGACHAVEDYVRRLQEESELLRTHCYRAMLELFIREARPDLCRAGIQTIKKAHMLPFTQYARLGLARVGLPPGLRLDPERVEAMLKQQGRVVVFFSLALLLAPVVETLVLLDRMIYLQEHGLDSQLVPLFNPNFSPRNFVLVGQKRRKQTDLLLLNTDSA